MIEVKRFTITEKKTKSGKANIMINVNSRRTRSQKTHT